ncbi:hypothetical protein [Caudoviricetes sp.]|nr:hypothetical protein [Caudoviricetes sp.]
MISSSGVTSGSLTATNQTVTVNATADEQVGVQVTGTFVGGVTFEATIDGTNWVAVGLHPAANAYGGGAAVATTATAAGLWRGQVIPFLQFRVRCHSYTSGPIVVSVSEAASGR